VKTCAVCGFRDAEDQVELDGRFFPACLKCIAPPVVEDEGTLEGELISRVRSIMRGAGAMRLMDVCAKLGVATIAGRDVKAAKVSVEDRRAYDAVLSTLRRLVSRGYLTHEGKAASGRLYTYVSARREVEIDRERKKALADRLQRSWMTRRSKRAA